MREAAGSIPVTPTMVLKMFQFEHIRNFLHSTSLVEIAWQAANPEVDINLVQEPFGGTGPYSLKEIFSWIYWCWSEETSSDPQNWSKQNPAWGECVVTAMWLHYLFRQQEQVEILNCRAKLPDGRDISHYALHLILSNYILDLTKIQFPIGTEFTLWKLKSGTQSNGWNYVTLTHSTFQRYEKFYDQATGHLIKPILQKLG